jgi:hypothetical protein
MTELDIVCTRKADGSDWSCSVTVTTDGAMTEHHVGVRAADLARLDPAAHDPHVLVDRSFRFLLAREPATSILRAFDLMEIARYFPEFEAEIRPD